MSCPYTTPQNGKAERMLRTINNVVRTMLLHASMPPSYWADALATATHVLNLLPTKTLNSLTPHFALHHSNPSYSHLRVFGCACYPNLTATAPHKLAPRSTRCVFLGYSPDHKGYRCLDVSSNRVIISRHVVFDKSTFPFSGSRESLPTEFDFLTNQEHLLARFSNSTGISPIARPVATADERLAPIYEPSDIAPRPPTPVPRAATPPAVTRGATPSTPPRAALDQAVFNKPPITQVYTRRSPTAPTAPAAPPVVTLSHGAVPTAPVENQHRMATRGKLGYRQPRLALSASALSPVPSTYRGALADPNWRRAMEEEFSALVSNHTWELVPLPPNAKVVMGK